MPDIKHHFRSGRMNKDLDERLVPNGEYRDAQNIEIITSEGSGVGSVQNVLGNTLKDGRTYDENQNALTLWGSNSSSIKDLTNPECIGYVVDEQNNKIYWFIASGETITALVNDSSANDGGTEIVLDSQSGTVKEGMIVTGGGVVGKTFVTGVSSNTVSVSNGVYLTDNTLLTFKSTISCIAEYDTITGVVAPILVDKNNILSFSSSYYITGANILDGLLLFTDNQTEPKKVIISDFKAGSSTFDSHTQINNSDFIEKDITLIRMHPLNAPTLTMSVSERTLSNRGLESGSAVFTRQNFYDTSTSEVKTSGAQVNLNFDPLGNFVKDDILKLKHTKIDGSDSVVYEIFVKIKILTNSTTIREGNIDASTYSAVCVIQTIPSNLPDLGEVTWQATLQEKKPIFQERFVRFAYRWKYKDNQYSAFSPFSKIAFLPGEFNYNNLNAYNSGMSNNLRTLTISGFDTQPHDVSEVEILLKESNINAVYVVDKLRNNETSYNVLNENIRFIVDSNQILRPYDNIPKKAKAQEVSGSRIIYANYYQGYNTLKTNIPKIEATVEQSPTDIVTTAKENPRGTGQHNVFTLTESNSKIQSGMKVTSQDGTFQAEDNIFVTSISDQRLEISKQKVESSNEVAQSEEKTISEEILLTFTQTKTANETVKSLRNYQLGATYSDPFGRESPVFSSINSSIYLDKTFSNTKNILTGELKNSPPDWATHFKLFVKETSSEYYNIALDRFYFAKDGNVWLSFPSAERNKITEDTFLLLKKKHDKNEAVTEDARYKVLDISNETPRFISTETIAAGKASCKIKSNPPEVGSVFFKFSGPSPQENPDFATAFKSQNQIEITTDVDGVFDDQNNSKRYTIKSGGSSNENIYEVILEDPIDPEDSNVFREVTSTTKQSNTAVKVDNSTSVTLTAANSLIEDGMFVTGTGITSNDVTVSSGGGTATLTLSSAQTIPASTELTFDKIVDHVAFDKEVNITIFTKEIRDKAEFFGRFFVKVKRDIILDNNVINSFNGLKSTFEQIAKQEFLQELANNYTHSSDKDNEETYTQDAAWTDNIKSSSRKNSRPNDQRGISSKTIDQTHPSNGKDKFSFYWSAIGNEDRDEDDLTQNINFFVSQITKRGSLIRFSNGFGTKGDIYQVTGSSFITEFRTADTSIRKKPYGKRRLYTIQIVNYISGAKTYTDVFDHAIDTNATGGNGRINNISIIEENVALGDNTISSDNPAIFETEPTSLEGLDIYYESSNSLPIIRPGMKVTGDGINTVISATKDSSDQTGNQVTLTADLSSSITEGMFMTGVGVPKNTTVKSVSGATVTLTKSATYENDIALTFSTVNFVNSVEDGDQFNLLNNVATDIPVDTVLTFTDENDLYSFTAKTTFNENFDDIPSGQKVVTLATNQVHGQPIELNFFNAFSYGNGVESNRIKDDFNTSFIDRGVVVSTTLDAEYKEENKENSFIFSGIFNSTSGVNELNQFIQALPITKDINPIYGSIQKLFVRETDLITFCEDKVLKVLANKDALFNADGNVNLTASTNVLGQAIGYVGEYGISKNPESFSSHAFRIYFADKARGAVLRLSRDGLTTISEKGMSDFFGDNLAASSTILGTYNEDKGSYNITLNNQTLSFDERVDGWTSFKSFIPEAGLSINNKYYTFKNGDLYSHDNTVRNTFYSTAYESSINVLINDIPTSVKSFKTLNYEGSDSRKYTYGGTASTAKVNGTISSSTTLVVDTNVGTIEAKDIVTGSGISGTVTVETVTDQNNLILSSAQSLTNNVDLTFTPSFGAGTTLKVLEDNGYTPEQIATLTETETKGWYANSITTDQQTGSVRFFKEKENFKFNKILGDTTTSSNIDTKELSVQGLGVPASISTSGTDQFPITITISNGQTGHNTTLPEAKVLSRSGTISESVTMIMTPNDGFEISASNFSFVDETSSTVTNAMGNATFDTDPSNANNVRVTIPLSFSMPSNAQTIQVNINGLATLKKYNVIGVLNTDEKNTTGSSLFNFGYSGSGDYFLHGTVNGEVVNSKKVALDAAIGIDVTGMTVIGSGVPTGTTVSSIASNDLRLSVESNIPNDTLLKFGKEIISKTFTADDGFAFPKNPTLDVIKQDENSISEYSSTSDYVTASTTKTGDHIEASTTFVVSDVTDIATTMLVTGEGITTATKVTAINSGTKTITVDNAALISSGTVLNFTPTVVVFKVHYVFSSNNPITDKLLITARANKGFLDKPDQITELQMSTQTIPITGEAREIKVVGRKGAKFILEEFTEGVVNSVSGKTVTLDEANHAISSGMTVTKGGSGIGKVESFNGAVVTLDTTVVAVADDVLKFRYEHNGTSFVSDLTNPNASTILTIPSNGVRTLNRVYEDSSNTRVFKYRVVASSPTTLSSSFIGDNPTTVSQFADVTFAVQPFALDDASSSFESGDATLGNTNVISITKNAGKSDQSTDLPFSFAIKAGSSNKLIEIKKPSFLDFQYSTVTNIVRDRLSPVNLPGGGCTVVIEFVDTINQTALVAGTAITGMAVKTVQKRDSSKPSLPDGIYLKSFEPTTVSTTTHVNLKRLTIAHDTKSVTELSESIQKGDEISFSAPYGYNLSFISLDGVMTDSNGTEIVSTKAIASANTSSTTLVLSEANTDIATSMRVSGNGISDNANVTVSSIATDAANGDMTITLNTATGVDIKKNEELTFFTDATSGTVNNGQTYVVSGNAQFNKFGTASLTSKFLFDDFVKAVALSNYAVKNTYAKAELSFIVSPDSKDTGGGNLKTRFPTISISKKSGTINQPHILYVGKGQDTSGDGKPNANSTSNDHVLTPDNEDLFFTLQIIFPKDPSYKNFYNIKVEADTNNKLFDNFNAGIEGGSAGVYKNSDIREIRNTPANLVPTFNMFEFDFSCKVNRPEESSDGGGLTINNTNLSIAFTLTVANSAGVIHPIEGAGAPQGSGTTTTNPGHFTDDGANITSFKPGSTSGGGIPIKADQF